MNNSISFVDLIQIYRESQIDIDSGKGSYLIKSSEELHLLQLLSSDEYNTNFNILDDDLEIGNTIKIQFGSPKSTFGRFNCLLRVISKISIRLYKRGCR